MEEKITGKVRLINPGNDSPSNCPAVNAYMRYSKNGPKGKEESFDTDLDSYAPKVVRRMYSMLLDIDRHSHSH